MTTAVEKYFQTKRVAILLIFNVWTLKLHYRNILDLWEHWSISVPPSCLKSSMNYKSQSGLGSGLQFYFLHCKNVSTEELLRPLSHRALQDLQGFTTLVSFLDLHRWWIISPPTPAWTGTICSPINPPPHHTVMQLGSTENAGCPMWFLIYSYFV